MTYGAKYVILSSKIVITPDYCVLEPLHISQLVQSEGTLPSQQDPLLLLLLHLVMMVFAFMEISMSPKISIKPFCVPRVAFSRFHYLWGQSETMILPQLHQSGLEITIKTVTTISRQKGKLKSSKSTTTTLWSPVVFIFWLLVSEIFGTPVFVIF